MGALGPGGDSESGVVVDFELGLPPNASYPWIYAPGTYQNKPDRPGNYRFWIAHGIDTADLPDGRYQLTVLAENTRDHIGSRTIIFETENGVPAAPVRTRRVLPGRPRAE